MHNLQIRSKRPPSQPSDLELIEAPKPNLTNGAFLARTLWLALDPFLCAPDAAAHDAAKPGDLVPAHGVGEVIESRHEVFGVGSLVVLDCGLQQLCVSDGQPARLLHPGQTPASSALGVLGAPGMAAYFGLLDLARLRSGGTVLVSAAADADGRTRHRHREQSGEMRLGDAPRPAVGLHQPGRRERQRAAESSRAPRRGHLFRQYRRGGPRYPTSPA